MYFNEYDNYPATWLANLFPDATIDARSITDVRASDTNDHIRCHFFAGIGGWEFALQLAGWEPDRPVWTASLPCQPFSVAGKRKGKDDERHLFPEFLRLVTERLPPTIFGEQVASADGREWLAGVFTGLEALGYAVAGADLCGASEGAPHIRQRLYWVANRDSGGRGSTDSRPGKDTEADRQQPSDAMPPSGVERLSDGGSERCDTWGGSERDERCSRIGGNQHPPGGKADRLEHGDSGGRDGQGLHILGRGPRQEVSDATRTSEVSGLSDSNQPDAGNGRVQRSWGLMRAESDPPYLQWGNTAILCADGKARRIEPSILPLAHGISNRVGRIRAYGNAIIPQVAAKFIRAYLETET